MRRLVVPILAFASLVASVHAAHADDADALFKSAKEAASHGDWEKACADFAASAKLDPAPGALLNLADCEERTGRLVLALDHFRDARARLGADDFRIAYADRRLAAITRRVPTVVLSSVSAASAVTRDGVPVPPSAVGAPIPLDPGAHTFVVRGATGKEWHAAVDLQEGEHRALEVRLEGDAPAAPAAAPAPPTATATSFAAHAPASSDSTGSGTRTLGWVLVAAGAAGIGAGAVTGVLALSKASDVKSTCGPDYTTCTQASVDDASLGHTFATVSTIAFVAGAALAAAGVYLVVRSPSRNVALGPTGIAGRF